MMNKYANKLIKMQRWNRMLEFISKCFKPQTPNTWVLSFKVHLRINFFDHPKVASAKQRIKNLLSTAEIINKSQLKVYLVVLFK